MKPLTFKYYVLVIRDFKPPFVSYTIRAGETIGFESLKSLKEHSRGEFGKNVKRISAEEAMRINGED